MSNNSSLSPDAQAELLQIGVELGYITTAHVHLAQNRQHELSAGGVQLPMSQVLMERRILSTSQVTALVRELEYRRRHNIGTQSTPAFMSQRIGQWLILQCLAQHGRCRVFMARDTLMNRNVVLKILPSEFTQNRVWLERFRREVQLAGRLQHPNIVTAYGTGELDGSPMLILEYVDGPSLGEKLQREGNMPEKTAWQAAREVTKALAHAASKGILHRDIKPENILFSKQGHIKICDLGLSKAVDDDMGLTTAGTTVGTPFYLSPEQARGTANLDERSDIYSLGCTVFHMLTGSVPFIGEQVAEVMYAHTRAPRPDPRSFLPEISAGSAALIARMMAINPALRPPSARALLVEIETLLQSLPEPESVERPVTRIDATEAPPAKGTAAAAPRRRPVFFPQEPKRSFVERAIQWLGLAR
ncbi:MAG TPA: serine/threonine-protein kinase [Planctomycetota bacterium]|nr:serine/threonine-protein kinase [Planctomycetota bacterium]